MDRVVTSHFALTSGLKVLPVPVLPMAPRAFEQRGKLSDVGLDRAEQALFIIRHRVAPRAIVSTTFGRKESSHA